MRTQTEIDMICRRLLPLPATRFGIAAATITGSTSSSPRQVASLFEAYCRLRPSRGALYDFDVEFPWHKIKNYWLFCVAIVVTVLEAIGLADPLKPYIPNFVKDHTLTFMFLTIAIMHTYQKWAMQRESAPNREIVEIIKRLIAMNESLYRQWKKLLVKHPDVKTTDPKLATTNMAKIDRSQIASKDRPFVDWYLEMDFYLGGIQQLYVDMLRDRDRYESDFPIVRNIHKAPIPSDRLMEYFSVHKDQLNLELRKRTSWSKLKQI